MATVAGLYDHKRAAAGAPFEPIRPSDSKWRGRRGELRQDFGPIFPLVAVKYGDNVPAVQRQEDGSGFANYPSGKKAICVLNHHQSRRVSAIIYASNDFIVKSAVPVNSRPGMNKLSEDEAAKYEKRGRTRQLGALDEWGVGILETVPDGTGARGSYEVSASHVTVFTPGPNGGRNKVSKAALAADTTGQENMSMRLSSEIVVTYDNLRGTTAIDFSCHGVSYTFHVGEVWKLPPAGRAPQGGSTQLASTTPQGIFENITLKTQGGLDTTTTAMTENASLLDKTLKISTSCLLSSSGAQSLGSPQGTGLLQKSASESTIKFSVDNFRTMTEGRLDFTQEHALRKKLLKEVHPVLAKTQVIKPIKEGYLYPNQHPGKPAGDPPQVSNPISLEYISCREVAQKAASLDGGSVLAVLVCATWAKKSQYSSSAHAQIVCEAAYGDLKAMGEDRVKFCIAELAEAGAIHSSTKYVNPLAKLYGVKEAPWLLMFSRGELVLSENVQGPNTGGIGFASRLRYMAFAKPRVLILEPAPTPIAAQAAAAAAALESGGRLKGKDAAVNNFKLQMETQEVLRRTGFDFDLAISPGDGMRLAATAQPPYGIMICSSEVAAGPFSEVSARIRERQPKALNFISHDIKSLGPLEESNEPLQALVNQKDLVAGVLRRPLTKSSLEGAMAGNDDVRIHYPTCGITKEALIEILKKKLNSV